MSSLNSIWENVLDQVKTNISEVTFLTWFKETELIDLNTTKALIKADNDFQRDWLVNQYTTLIENSVSQTTGEKDSIRIIVNDEFTDLPNDGAKNKSKFAYTSTPVSNALNEQHTFDTLVISDGNRVALAASLAVAEA